MNAIAVVPSNRHETGGCDVDDAVESRGLGLERAGDALWRADRRARSVVDRSREKRIQLRLLRGCYRAAKQNEI